MGRQCIVRYGARNVIYRSYSFTNVFSTVTATATVVCDVIILDYKDDDLFFYNLLTKKENYARPKTQNQTH